MNTFTEMNINQLLGEHSRTIRDPADRDVRILEDSQVLKIADQSGCSVRHVYIEALGLGIWPHRYVRNREILSARDQRILAKSRVSVTGAGGLGGSVILLLARIGIGRLVVVDHDIFDESNLNRQALCSEKTLGKSKSEEAAKIVGSVNPGVEVTSIKASLEPSSIENILAGSQVVVDCLDNVPDRFLLERASKNLGIPLVHGALAGFEGQLMTIFPDDPGLKNLYGDGDEGASIDRSKSPESVLGVVAPTASLMANLQVMEVLKIILERGRIFRNMLLHVDLEAGRMDEFSF
jgi:molybdopterin/thiamine biosynthesis adenylyltransferase